MLCLANSGFCVALTGVDFRICRRRIHRAPGLIHRLLFLEGWSDGNILSNSSGEVGAETDPLQDGSESRFGIEYVTYSEEKEQDRCSQ